MSPEWDLLSHCPAPAPSGSFMGKKNAEILEFPKAIHLQGALIGGCVPQGCCCIAAARVQEHIQQAPAS